MKFDSVLSEEHRRLLENVSQREEQEATASATITSQTLAKLKISIENLPQKCRQLLDEVSKVSQLSELDPLAMSVRHTEAMAEELQDDYEILKLEQKNRQLSIKIERNKKILENMRRELNEAKISLSTRAVNPENVVDHIRQVKLKVASYEENYEKSKLKMSKLAVPESLFPKSLEVLVSQLATLKVEEATLKEKADDFQMTNELRLNLKRLRN